MEIEPMRSYGGANPSEKDDLFTVSEAIRLFAEDIGLAYTTVRSYRWVSSRWPKEHRRADVSHTIHKTLASIPDEQERFETVSNPLPNLRGGSPRWTHDSAKRVVGWKVDFPESVQEKVEAIHDLATDDAVAAVVTTDFLRRPAIASKAMADDTARHAVNEAQFDRFRQQAQFVHEEAAPQLQRMEHSAQFMDLVAACAQFVATAGRIVPNLRGEHYDDGERETIGRGLARLRAAADWIEDAVTRGEVDLDEWPRGPRRAEMRWRARQPVCSGPGCSGGVHVRATGPFGPLLVLHAPSIAGDAAWLVNREGRGREQHQYGGSCVGQELNSHPIEVGAGQVRPHRCIRHVVGHLHVQQEEERGHDGQRELRQHPVVAQQPPCGAQRLDEPGQQRGESQRDDHVPAGQLHGQIGALGLLGVLAAQADDGEHQKHRHRAQPADRGRDVRGERKLADAGGHCHQWPPCMPGPIPLPVRCRTRNSTTTASATAPETFTQRGAPGGIPRSGAAPPPEGSDGESVMRVPFVVRARL
ncbi:DUF6192 family protein [Streptomyces jeddahensis]|uniref:DUF6192 family protein n=1 Tax=Streptomyces jeddahensis TaxID=1716141 RepID=UPI000B0C7D85|nr:DUF6192 family protein [Streptomyces jeddahensis]